MREVVRAVSMSLMDILTIIISDIKHIAVNKVIRPIRELTGVYFSVICFLNKNNSILFKNSKEQFLIKLINFFSIVKKLKVSLDQITKNKLNIKYCNYYEFTFISKK